MSRTVLATVLCGRCTNEHRREPGRLGTVEELGTVEQWAARLVWCANDPAAARGWRQRGWAPPGQHVPQFIWLDGDAEEVAAFCRHHGAGTVSTNELRNARGKLALTFRATA